MSSSPLCRENKNIPTYKLRSFTSKFNPCEERGFVFQRFLIFVCLFVCLCEGACRLIFTCMYAKLREWSLFTHSILITPLSSVETSPVIWWYVNICVCLWVCVCVCVCACVSVYACVCVCVSLCVCMSLCVLMQWDGVLRKGIFNVVFVHCQFFYFSSMLCVPQAKHSSRIHAPISFSYLSLVCVREERWIFSC